MRQETVLITNRLGLHARAAARLVRLAGQFQSRIMLSRPDIDRQPADAQSIFGVLLLAAAQGTEIRIEVDGADEEEALAAIVRLIMDKFGED